MPVPGGGHGWRADVDLDQDLIYVLGKGRRERACPFGCKTVMALDRYVRNRGKLRRAARGRRAAMAN